MNNSLKLLIRTTLIGLAAGLLASCVAAASSTFGGTGSIVWANWQPLGTPPQRPTSIIATSAALNGIGIVVGAGNKKFYCCPAGPANWQEVAPDDKYIQDWFGPATNNRHGTVILNYPPNSLDSVVNVSCEETCGSERHYVIQSDGSVWTWGLDGKNSADGPGPVPTSIAGLTGSAYFPPISGEPNGSHYIEWGYAAGPEINFTQYDWLIGAFLGLIIGAVLARFSMPTDRLTSLVFTAFVMPIVFIAIAVPIIAAPFALMASGNGNTPHTPIATAQPTATLGAEAPATVTSAEVTPAASGTPQAVARLVIQPGTKVFSVAFSPDGRLLAGTTSVNVPTGAVLDNSVRIWDAKTGVELRRVAASTYSLRWDVAFSPDSRLLADASNGGVEVADAATGTVLRVLHGSAEPVRSVAFSPDGRLLASVEAGGTARLWDVATGAEVRELTGHQITAVAFSPDGRLLASAGGDGTVRLWDPATGAQLSMLQGDPGIVSAVAFSPDSRLLVSGGPDQTVRIWDVTSGKLLHLLAWQPDVSLDVVNSVAFSPDGRLIASASQGGAVRLWDAETGKIIQVLAGHTGSVFEVAFSPDGHTLASASEDMTVLLWDVHE